jgi:DNA-directed RNA polymerase subunit RPC12/RpoP
VDQLKSERSQDNINVTLGKPKAPTDSLLGQLWPCQFCGAGLDIRISKNDKPYVTCSDCGTQLFVRGKTGIKRLRGLLNAGALIAGHSTKGDSPIVLFNRLQQLRAEKRDLEGKQRLMIRDSDLMNAIRAVDNEIKQVQGELEKMSRKSSPEKRK